MSSQPPVPPFKPTETLQETYRRMRAHDAEREALLASAAEALGVPAANLSLVPIAPSGYGVVNKRDGRWLGRVPVEAEEGTVPNFSEVDLRDVVYGDESPLDRALRDGGDERDGNAPREEAVRRVREAARRCTCDMYDPGDPENGPRLVVYRDVLCPDHGRRADPEYWAEGDDPSPITYLHEAWAEAMSEPPATCRHGRVECDECAAEDRVEHERLSGRRCDCWYCEALPQPVEPKWKVRVLHASPSSVTTETTAHLVSPTGEAVCGERLSSTARPASITDRRCPACKPSGERGSARLGVVLALALVLLLALAAPALAQGYKGIGHTRLNSATSILSGATPYGEPVYDMGIRSTGGGWINIDATVTCSTRSGRVFQKTVNGSIHANGTKYAMPIPSRKGGLVSCQYQVSLDQVIGYGANVSVVYL